LLAEKQSFAIVQREKSKRNSQRQVMADSGTANSLKMIFFNVRSMSYCGRTE